MGGLGWGQDWDPMDRLYWKHYLSASFVKYVLKYEHLYVHAASANKGRISMKQVQHYLIKR